MLVAIGREEGDMADTAFMGSTLCVEPAVLCVLLLAGAFAGYMLGRLLSEAAPGSSVGQIVRTAVGSEEEHKMVLCVRRDLKMGKGKIAAQCGHATLGAYKKSVKRNPEAIAAWEEYGQTKITLIIQDEAEMLQLSADAKKAGLVSHIVIDAGHTQVDPMSKTVLAIGPAPKPLVNTVTGHLRLMN